MYLKQATHHCAIFGRKRGKRLPFTGIRRNPTLRPYCNKEVGMNQTESFQLNTEAAKALAEWKAVFSAEVIRQAKLLAQKSDAPGVITLAHYREAALSAVQSLANVIQDADSHDGRQKAA